MRVSSIYEEEEEVGEKQNHWQNFAEKRSSSFLMEEFSFEKKNNFVALKLHIDLVGVLVKHE